MSKSSVVESVAVLWTVVVLAFTASAAFAASVPTPPDVKAKAYIVQDFESGRVLVESNADERLEPASLTKMMTTYVVLAELREGEFRLEDQVLVSEKAWRMKGSRMFIEVGTRVSVEKLLKGVIIQSGNDASVALAEFVAGDEVAFADLMNDHARRLGATGTHFVNSSGLPDPEHYTTARDMSRIAAALIRDFPEHYAWHAIREFEYNNIKQFNRNRLLWRDDTVDGVKTGHTESAGYCLVASARQDRMRLIATVMGSQAEKARANETQALLRYGFRFFETHRVYEAGKSVAQVRVWKGETDQLDLGVAEDLYVTVPRGEYDKLNPVMVVPTSMSAPIREGTNQGTVRVTLEGEEIATRPLMALHTVPEGGLWKRMKDSVKLWLE